MKKLSFLLIAFVVTITSLAQSTKKQPFILGHIDTLYSNTLGETRTLNIYLPEGYSPDSAATYPVIYLLDGSADEDFIHIVGLVQYYNFPWIDRVPKSIVVGIANVNRKRDFTYAVPNLDFVSKIGFEKSQFPAYGGSEKFISFIEKELQPYIIKNYKANTQKTLIGQSLGGLVATEILLKKTELFNNYIIMSPSLWWDNESLLKKVPETFATKEKVNVYVGVGKEGEIMVGDAKKLFDLLKKGKLNTFYDYLPEETHATMTHIAVYNAFKLLYPAK